MREDKEIPGALHEEAVCAHGGDAPLPCPDPNFAVPPDVPGLVTWEWNIPANTVYFSREWRRIIQDPDKESAGPSTHKWWPRVHEDDVIPFLDEAREVVEGCKETYQTLFRLRRNDGQWIWLLSRGRVMERDGDRAVRVCGAIMDVSELRSDVKFQHGSTVANGIGRDDPESSPELIVSMGADLLPLFANPCIVSAMTRGGNLEPPPGELGFRPEHLEFLRNNVKRVLTEGRSVREQVTFATVYGHDVIGEYSFWPEFTLEGKVASVITQFRDLTDHILEKRRARLNEMRLESLYRLNQMDSATEEEVRNFVLDCVINLTRSEYGYLFFPDNYPDVKGRVVWSANHYAIADRESLPMDSLCPSHTRRILGKDGKETWAIRNGNSLHPIHIALNGRLRVMRYISVPTMDNGRVVCIAGLCNKQTDYTEADVQQVEAFVTSAWHILRRHKFVRELERAKDAAELAKDVAEHASRVKDAFLANVSHELRTPLNGVLSMLQLLTLMPLTDQQREYVRTADASGQTLMRIIADILDFSHMKSGKMSLKNEVFNLARSLEAPLDIFRSQAENKGLAFNVYFDNSIPDALLGDDMRIRQIVFNVVGNALKFTEHGEVSVHCSLIPSSNDERACIGFSVRDTGIGIAPELQQSMFDAFTQARGSTSDMLPGTGLGLSIVRNLTEMMGGEVSLESEPGKGTIVNWALHLSLPQETEATEFSFPGPQGAYVPESLSILVAEDDPVSRFALRSFLQKAGHRVVCAPSGRLALELLMLYPFRCLFTDIQMPDMDGLELVRRIREDRAEDVLLTQEARNLLQADMPGIHDQVLPVPVAIPIVAVSAHAMTGDKERFLALGMDFYISKPVIMGELKRVLESITRRLKNRS